MKAGVQEAVAGGAVRRSGVKLLLHLAHTCELAPGLRLLGSLAQDGLLNEVDTCLELSILCKSEAVKWRADISGRHGMPLLLVSPSSLRAATDRTSRGRCCSMPGGMSSAILAAVSLEPTASARTCKLPTLCCVSIHVHCDVIWSCWLCPHIGWHMTVRYMAHMHAAADRKAAA